MILSNAAFVIELDSRFNFLLVTAFCHFPNHDREWIMILFESNKLRTRELIAVFRTVKSTMLWNLAFVHLDVTGH